MRVRVAAWLVCLAPALAMAADPPDPLPQPERERLTKQALRLNDEGLRQIADGEPAQAAAKLAEALAIWEKLKPPAADRVGQANLAGAYNNLGDAWAAAGDAKRALRFYEKAIAVKRLLYPAEKFPDGHADLVISINGRAQALHAIGEYEQARALYAEALDSCRKLYPPAKFPTSHLHLAASLNNFGQLLTDMDALEEALPVIEEAIRHFRKLYSAKEHPGGHPFLIAPLNNLGLLHQRLGESGRAIDCHRESLQLVRNQYPAKRFPRGHPELANSLNNLGDAYRQAGDHQAAERFLRMALDMKRNLYPASQFPAGHPDLLIGIHNVATLLNMSAKFADARPLFVEALAMARRLYPASDYPAGHPDQALCLRNLGAMLLELREPREAAERLAEALAICRKLYPLGKYPVGHPDLAAAWALLGAAHAATGERREALKCLEEALQIDRKLLDREMSAAPEARALELIHHKLGTLDHYLTVAENFPGAEERSFLFAAEAHGRLLELLQRRHQAALADRSQSAFTRKEWNELMSVRRAIARLQLEPGGDAAARDRRLAQLEEQQAKLERQLARVAPGGPPESAWSLDALRTALPRDAAYLHFVRYRRQEAGRAAEARYLVHVVSPDRPIARVSLGEGEPIYNALVAWQRDIAAGAASRAAADMRRLVWDKIAALLPQGTKTIFIYPDGNFTRVPFAALPGTRPDTVLLEEYAFAIAPTPRWPASPTRDAVARPPNPREVLVVGDVDYGRAEAGSPFPPLPATRGEIASVLTALSDRPEGGLRQSAATVAAVRARLPDVRYAHFATHGFFDVQSVAKQRKRGSVCNPMGFVGLALAGSNRGQGEGVLTGLDIVDLPLDRLRLATLSACETGLGDIAIGEGVQGLPRAFHIAGCANVVATLWKVNDAAAAALMAKFYHELWIHQKPPLEALREAQLTIYRHPERIPALAGERGRPNFAKAVELRSDGGTTPGPGKRAATRLWAAFVLSGPGK